MDTIEKKYAFFDADNVGSTIEILLRENKIDKAVELSENIKHALLEIERNIRSQTDIKILISAGDDLLIEFKFQPEISAVFLNETRVLFFEKTSLSLSCGVGDSIPNSVENLYLAKLYGKNRIIGV